jgi:uncharacterized protein YndB with AHSA1/START domain
MMVDAEDLVIRKKIRVEVPIARAFEVFTQGLQDWWPVETHSLEGGVPSADWRPGGLVVETSADGRRFEWADVLEYDPPEGLRLRWRVNPGKPPTELKVTFVADGAGTIVKLVHAGWESYSDGAEEGLASYTSGWDIVLGRYLAHSET